MSKTKLFLSYGRADAKDIATKIKLDLQNQGYEVWMDENEIKAGSAYMSDIANNLSDSNAVIALMSPHSVRSVIDGAMNDSVCLDEIAYAKDYPGRILPVMVSKCKVPIFIYRLDYVDLCTWQLNEDEYRIGLKRVIEGIEATLRNEINYKASQKELRPYDFSPFLLERSKGFVGREWLFTEVINWLESKHSETALLITADPGVGKSAFVGRWITLNPGGHLLAYHCCQIDIKQTLEPDCFIRNLAAMISSQIPEYEDMLKESNVQEALEINNCQKYPDCGFEQGIIAPLLRLNPPSEGYYCILIDALDEAILLKEGKVTIVNLLEKHLRKFPSWLRVIATTRNEPDVLNKLSGLRAKEFIAQDTRNIEDARAYLVNQFNANTFQGLFSNSNTNISETIEVLLERSKGNFLYLHYALEGLLFGNFHIDRLDEFPPGLTGFYENAFKERFGNNEIEYQPIADILAIILASRVPISEKMLFTASGLSSKIQITKYLNSLSGYIKIIDNSYSFYHRSFAEWLRDKNNLCYHIEPLVGDSKLANSGWSEYKSVGVALNMYMLKYLPDHLTAVGHYNQLAEFLTDFDIMEIIWKNDQEHEWRRHWLLIMDKIDIIEAYQISLEKLISKKVDLNIVSKAFGRVGALLRDLGLHDKALPFAKKGVELLRESANPDNEELASALLILAELYRHLSEFDEAETLYLESLKLQEDIWPDSVEVGKIVYALCVFYNTCTKRDIDKSIYYNEWAIKIQEKQTPINYGLLADAINDKGILLNAKGKREESYPFFDKSRQLFEKGFPEGHPELAVVLTNIALYHFEKKEYQKALDLNIAGLKMRLMFVVPYDSKCQRFRRDNINYCISLEKYGDAQKWAEEVLEISEMDSSYQIETKISDIIEIIFITFYTKDSNNKDKWLKKLFKEIKKETTVFDKVIGDNIIQLFYSIILFELNGGRQESALSYFKLFVNFLENIQPQPYKSLSKYYILLAELFQEIGQEDIEKQFREYASNWQILGDKRLPYLLKIEQAKDLLKNTEFKKVKELMNEVFNDALIREVEIDGWNEQLGWVANNFAMEFKNNYNEYELSSWFYKQGYLLDPKNDILIGNYAFLLTSVFQDNEQAEIYFKKALEINPNEANCLSNYAVFYTNVRKDYQNAEELFEKAYKLNSNHNDTILSNYAILKIIRRDLDQAIYFAKESYKECSKKPDRVMVRPLFCAAVVMAIEHKDYKQYLAQIKTLFLMGIQRVPWQVNSLIEYIKDKVTPKDYLILEAVWLAVCNKENDLDLYDDWINLRPMPLDRPWIE